MAKSTVLIRAMKQTVIPQRATINQGFPLPAMIVYLIAKMVPASHGQKFAMVKRTVARETMRVVCVRVHVQRVTHVTRNVVNHQMDQSVNATRDSIWPWTTQPAKTWMNARAQTIHVRKFATTPADHIRARVSLGTCCCPTKPHVNLPDHGNASSTARTTQSGSWNLI